MTGQDRADRHLNPRGGRRAAGHLRDPAGAVSAALDAGADPVAVAGRISETPAERDRALERLRVAQQSQQPVEQLSIDDIAMILDQPGDLVAALAEAEPEDKCEVYRNLGLRLTYRYDERLVQATIDLDARWGLVVSKNRHIRMSNASTGPECGYRSGSPIQGTAPSSVGALPLLPLELQHVRTVRCASRASADYKKQRLVHQG